MSGRRGTLFGDGRKKKRDPLDHLEHIEHQLGHIGGSLEALVGVAGKLLECSANGGGLGGYVASIQGRGRNRTMPINVPVPALLDVEKIVLSVMPRKADGHVDAAATVSWTSSDEAQVGIEPGTEAFDYTDPQNGDEVVSCPGAFNCTATTPLESGSASVTVSARGYESAEFGPISYAPGVARSLNASIGSPISDV